MVFFAIWWTWVNYSWFASAYDTGDVSFRLLTFVVMTGVLVFAQGGVAWVSFVALAVLEMAGPFWAERAGPRTPWHRQHIAERYELFTIIVLGEVILASTQAISGALDEHGLNAQLVMLILGALLMVFSMWWIYFKRHMVDSLAPETSFVFGYVHYIVFAAIAATGACLATLVDVVQQDAEVESRTAVLLLAVALSLADHVRRTNRSEALT